MENCFAPPDAALKAMWQAQGFEPQMATAAKAQYDAWDESDVDTFAGGGICHLIADALVSVLQANGVECCSVPSEHEQHVFVVCQLVEGVFLLDLPYAYYERGAGYTWYKLPDVIFTANLLFWNQLSRDR